jgi:predicted nucleotidyltransferase
MKTAGVVLDMYDDRGAMLPQLTSVDAIPDFAKEAAVLDAEQLGELPNDAFALAAVDGDSVIRKYATVDPGNTWFSTQYFLSQRGYLPKTAQAHVAARLLGAHKAHHLAAPEELVKVALSLRASTDDAEVADVTGQEPTPVFEQEKVAEDHMILGKYPVRTYEEVKLADGFFAENLLKMHPEERRSFAVKLAARATDLGIVLEGEAVHKYASSERASDAQMYVLARKEFLPESHQPALEKFAAEMHDVEPRAAAEALRGFDEATGLAHLWDHHVVDPYYTMLGEVKTAEEFIWAEGAERVTESDLKALAANSVMLLRSHFGNDFTDEFCKDPVAVFKSMPDTTKVVLARLGADSGFSPSHG